MKTTVIAATQNKHKLKELRAIMEKFGMEVISQAEAGLADVDVVEDGETFEENSYKKAYEIMKLSGKIAVADDSGLAVDYLGGAPGVYSARYAGEHKSDADNNKKLHLPQRSRGEQDLCPPRTAALRLRPYLAVNFPLQQEKHRVK